MGAPVKFATHSPVVVLFALMAGSCASADSERSILPRNFDTASTLHKAVAVAKEKNKAVILYYTRTNCPPCTVLQSRLRKEEVAAPLRAAYVFTVVWGSYMSYNERESYRRRYDVQGASTWIVFSSNGEYVCTASGGFNSDKGGRRLHEAVQARLATLAGSSEADPTHCLAAK